MKQIIRYKVQYYSDGEWWDDCVSNPSREEVYALFLARKEKQPRERWRFVSRAFTVIEDTGEQTDEPTP